MEHDNAANQANFDEISAHISMAQAKLKTATGEQRELLLADQNDYWERAVQVRKMAADTYCIERNEAREECGRLHALYRRAYWQRAALLVVCLLALVVLAVQVLAPGLSVAALEAVPVGKVLAYGASAAAGSGYGSGVGSARGGISATRSISARINANSSSLAATCDGWSM